jgi:hypothetical protein
METKQERRNRLARERYTQNERTRERYQSKARAAISERNQKRKDEIRANAKERGLVFYGSKKYNINELILESYKQERKVITKLDNGELYWKTEDGIKALARHRTNQRWKRMTDDQKKQLNLLKKKPTKEQKKIYALRHYNNLKKHNPEKLKEMQRKYRITSRSKPLNRAKSNMRNRFRDALKHYRQTQRDTMSSMIGCTWSFFDKWIVSQFKRGMKWENYGSIWHIDHIEPLAHFDVTDQNDMKRAWHYSNLRPLKAAENLKKGAKIVTCQPELSITMI